MRQVALTTTDNKFDYFTDYDRWRHFDEDEMGYFTESYVARIAHANPLLPPALLEQIWEEAINDICALNITGKYKKVYREV